MSLKMINSDAFSSYRVNESFYEVVKINLSRAVIDNVTEFKEYIAKHHAELKQDLILDFSDTNFIDSSFLGSIVSLLKKLKLGNGSLSLVINSSKITFLLPVKEISKVINIYPTVNDAVAKLNRFTIS